MKNKELYLYIKVYKFFLSLIEKNNVKLSNVYIRTDQEDNIFKGFEIAFSGFCTVTHNYCKRHFTESLKNNLRTKGNLAWITYGRNLYNPDFSIFYQKIKLLGLLPHFLIIEMKEFLIMELMTKFDAPAFVTYVRQKITADFALRLSYYKIIKSPQKT